MGNAAPGVSVRLPVDFVILRLSFIKEFSHWRALARLRRDAAVFH
jgi:hypothetical protein